MDLISENSDIEFNNIFYLSDLSVSGKGIVDPDDIILLETEEKFTCDDSIYSIEIEEGITEIKAGFFEKFPSLQDLTLSFTVNHIEMTKEFENLLQKNNIIIHGEYDTFAEEFSKKYKLKFIPSDIILTEYKNPNGGGPFNKIILILKFNQEGKIWIFEETISSGNSVGNLGGGEVNYDIPKSFFFDDNTNTNTNNDNNNYHINKNCTIEKFSEHFSTCYRKDILNNQKLQRFFKKLKDRPEIGQFFKGSECNNTNNNNNNNNNNNTNNNNNINENWFIRNVQDYIHKQ
ncbi:hypothetical protein BCR32DRAFT_291709 [Anaeromyces robustus]|uniref:Uncharacterized protein n=1 Tax=Anaeromyces robustus TaxID=1754192 RepID=A0A1Y1XDU5_9FUNG|nr:hypothetical protein BCR32DRAFT_291709 [Anaeromyces robustus]|eukprot:ORX83895.1 hypothetical protein BCR32DRAFT_291709 [Anaeromyces robustus]